MVSEILEIVNEFLGSYLDGLLDKVPSYTTIGYWVQRLGLSVYNESHKRFKNKRYALIVDESMMIGSEKLLLVLATNADNAGHAVNERDVAVVDISVRKSWNGESVSKVLKKVAEKIGHAPEFVIGDNGSVIKKGIRDANFRQHRDIGHSLGMFLERVYKNEADFQGLSKNVQNARLKFNMQRVAFLQPPSQRSIARFMNMSDWTDWGVRMLHAYHVLPKDAASIYKFVPKDSSLVEELREVTECVDLIDKDLKRNGISHESVKRCKRLVCTRLMNGNDRQRKLGDLITDYLDEEVSFVEEGRSHNASSDIIESTFGVVKSRMPDNKLTGVTPLILMLPLRLSLAGKKMREKFEFKERLETGRHRHIKEWASQNLTVNLAIKRTTILGKKCASF